MNSKIQIKKAYKSFENSSNLSFKSSSNSDSFSIRKKKTSSSFKEWANELQEKLNTASLFESESEDFNEILTRKISSSSLIRHEIVNENISLNYSNSLESLSIKSSLNSSVFSTCTEDLSMVNTPQELSVHPVYDTSHLRPPPSYFPVTPRISIRISSNVGPIKSLSGTCNVKIGRKK